MKGLIQYLNWQDNQPSRIKTVENDYPKDADYTVQVQEDDIMFAIKGDRIIQ